MSVQANVMQFVRQYAPEAVANHRRGGAPPRYKLAAAALESNWGKSAPGNNFFGIKASASWQGERQLLTTWEAGTAPRLQSGESLIKTYAPGENGNPFQGRQAHRVKVFFRKYKSPEDGFSDHDNLLKKERYSGAWKFRDDSIEFAREVARSGYATDPAYFEKLKKVISMIDAATKENGNSTGGRIVYAPGADQGALPAWAILTVVKALEDSGNPSAKVTSTRRTPEEQAAAMYANIEAKGEASQRRLYGQNGDSVISAYSQARSAGKAAALAAMTRKIKEIGPGKVSTHCGDFSRVAVLDISPGSLSRPADFLRAIKAAPGVIKVIGPPDDPAYHIEIQAPTKTTGTDDSLFLLGGLLIGFAIFSLS